MTTFNFIETVILAFSCQQWLFDQNEGSSETFQIKYSTSILCTYIMYIEYIYILNIRSKRRKNICIIFQQYYPALVILRTEYNFETSSSLFMVSTPSHIELCPCSTSNVWMPLRWPLRDNRESQSTVLSGIPFLGLADPPRSLWKQDIAKAETCYVWHERLLSLCIQQGLQLAWPTPQNKYSPL